MHWTENPAMQVRVLPVAQLNSVVEESGLSHLLWEQRHAGSNPAYATKYDFVAQLVRAPHF